QACTLTHCPRGRSTRAGQRDNTGRRLARKRWFAGGLEITTHAVLAMTAEPQVQGKHASQPGGTLMRRPLILSGVFAVLATLLLADLAPRYAPGLLRFEHYLGDVRTARLSDQLASQHPSVAIVAITDDTLAGYRTYLPVDRDLLARVVEAVDAAGAKVIGLDFLFTSPAGDGNEILLIEAIR